MTRAAQLKRRFDELKDERGRHFSYMHVRDLVRDMLGADYCPTPESIRLMHFEDGPEPNPIWLAAVCDIYGLELEDVSPKAFNYLRTVGMYADKWCHVGRIDLSDRPIPSSSCDADFWADWPKLFDDSHFFIDETLVPDVTYAPYRKAS